MAKILVVDDDVLSLEFLNIFLESEGHQVNIAVNLTEAYAFCASDVPDILISDLNLGDESGESIVKHAKETNDKLKVILITGYDKVHLSGLDIAYDYLLTKPVDLNKLQEFISQLN